MNSLSLWKHAQDLPKAKPDQILGKTKSWKGWGGQEIPCLVEELLVFDSFQEKISFLSKAGHT